MKEQILVFGVTDPELKKKLQRALMPLRLKVREVSPEECGQTIGEIAGVTAKEGQKDAPGTDPAGGVLSDPMLVFAGLTSGRLDQVLRSLRKNQIALPYKAVMTPSSQNWTPAKLLGELKKEHEMMH
ncbi:MAG: DUF3783 domain-containing protein [Bilifractor sp.]|jgi:hypothetical protein